jgi:hypothetical protein
MSSTDADDAAFGLPNRTDRKMFGFPNVSRLREALRVRGTAAKSGRDSGLVPRTWGFRFLFGQHPENYPDGIPINSRTVFRELSGRHSDKCPDITLG